MSENNSEIFSIAEQIIHKATALRLQITTAESCTGGLIMGALTDIAGSSAVIDRGFITYSNKAKCQVLDVSTQILRDNGAVSEPTVRAMAMGALAKSPSHIAVAVSGIAGPDGGSDDKPVGTVCFGFAHRKIIGEPASVTTQTQILPGPDRFDVRQQTVHHALLHIISILNASG